MLTKKNRPGTKIRAWRPTPQDEVLLKRLMEKTGIADQTNLLRFALRRLAEAERLA